VWAADLPPLSWIALSWTFQFRVGPGDGGIAMKKSKVTHAQIAFVPRQTEDRTAIGEVCRKASLSEATFYNWRKKYGGLIPSEIWRLK
jgi:hypothetical protein